VPAIVVVLSLSLSVQKDEKKKEACDGVARTSPAAKKEKKHTNEAPTCPLYSPLLSAPRRLPLAKKGKDSKKKKRQAREKKEGGE